MKKVIVFLFAISSFLFIMKAQEISYIIPDIGTPGMNTYVEIIGPYNRNGNFGEDGIYLNNNDDYVRLKCLYDSDNKKIIIGPLIVSWNGRMISTQIFVNPDIHPNSNDWTQLNNDFKIPIIFKLGDSTSNQDTFYIIKPQNINILNDSGKIGDGGDWGIRSKRGSMIVDSLNLPAGIFKFSTKDCNPYSPYNEGFLPVIILSKGIITMNDDATMSVSADSIDGGPGGGGGGHGEWRADEGLMNNIPIDTSKYPYKYLRNGYGYTDGGGDLSGNFETSQRHLFKINSKGLNGIESGNNSYSSDAGGGGGTGSPFITSALAGNYDCPNNNNSGAGSPGEDFSPNGREAGGAGAGYSSDGESTCGNNNGRKHGNKQITPLIGGSGGGGGNGYNKNISGSGGGGGGAIVLFGKSLKLSNIHSNGANGAFGIIEDSITNGKMSYGGGGSGGSILLLSKVDTSFIKDCQINGGSGIKDSAELRRSGGNGSQGRLRIDGNFDSTNLKIPFFRGPSSDTTCFVGTPFDIKGTSNGNDLIIYVKDGFNSNWVIIDTLKDSFWKKTFTSTEIKSSDSIAFIVFAQQIKNNTESDSLTQEPEFIFSQAAANIIILKKMITDISSDKKMFVANINISPNPAFDILSINYSFPENNTVSIILSNTLGQKVGEIIDNKMLDAGEYKSNYDVSGLTPGVYFITLQAGSYVETKKFVVIK